MTKQWLTLLALGASLSSGCASTPAADPWAGLEAPTELAERPEPLDAEADWPAPIAQSEQSVTFDLAGAVELERYRIAGGGNSELAEAHADEVDALRLAAGELIAAGKAQRLVADLRLEILEEERKRNAWEKLTLYAGMLLVLIGAGTL